MDQSAIKEINDNAAVSSLNQHVANYDVPCAFLPENFKVHNMEKFQDRKSRFTGSFSTSHVESFRDYYEGFSAEEESEIVVFVDSGTMSARTTFDLGSIEEPLHGEHTATLKLDKTAAFKAFESITGRKISQRDAAEFIEDWRDLITAIDSSDSEMDLKRLINTVRKITIEQKRKSDSSEGQFTQSRSALEEIEAKSEEGELPKLLIFKCEPYNCLPEMEFRFRMAIHTVGDVAFTFHRIKAEDDQERIADEFVKVLTDSLGERVPILQGTFQIK